MDRRQYALCVKFADANTAQIVSAARTHKVAILHIENYNPRKDYSFIFEEYPLEIPADAKLLLLFVFANGESILTNKEQLHTVFEKVHEYMLEN